MATMIENLTYRGKTLTFSSPASRALGSILNVDSFTLLIGINGSGKTTLLIDAASVLARGARAGQHGTFRLLSADGTSVEINARHVPPGYGAVYYTALPYRRPLRSGGRLINAAPARTSGKDNKSIELLQDIARGLGTEARLLARITYLADFVDRLLVPAVLESSVVFHDDQLQEDYSALRGHPFIHRHRQIAADGLPPEDRSGAPTVGEEWEYPLRDFKARLVKVVSRALDEKGSFFRVVSLASLEVAFERFDRADDLAIFMLHDCGVLQDELHWHRDGGRFTAIRYATLRYISNENGDIGWFDREDPDRIDFEIKTDTDYARLLLADTAIRVKWEGLSSGLFALVEQFANIDDAIGCLERKNLRKILLFIDEGDAFLHLEWQRKYIDLLNRFLGNCASKHELESLQVVLATHSPILAGDLPSSMIQSLDKDQRDFKTFGATLDDIVLRSFRSNSIGEFAAQHIRRLHLAVAQGTLTATDRLLLEEIGDPVLKKEVLGNRRADHDR
jgi:predicted ATPase